MCGALKTSYQKALNLTHLRYYCASSSFKIKSLPNVLPILILNQEHLMVGQATPDLQQLLITRMKLIYRFLPQR